MDSPQVPDLTRKSLEAQAYSAAESAEGRAPNMAEERQPEFEYELVTLREACKRFPGLHDKLIYRWARLGLLHPVRPNGRRLYPLWELEALVGRNVNGGYSSVAA